MICAMIVGHLCLIRLTRIHAALMQSSSYEYNGAVVGHVYQQTLALPIRS